MAKKTSKTASTVKAMRLSGLPVNREDYVNFQADWAEFYDKATAKHENGERLTKLLQNYEDRLKRKYPNVVEWKEIKTKKAWSKIVSEYGMVMVGQEAESKELVYVIADTIQL